MNFFLIIVLFNLWGYSFSQLKLNIIDYKQIDSTHLEIKFKIINESDDSVLLNIKSPLTFIPQYTYWKGNAVFGLKYKIYRNNSPVICDYFIKNNSNYFSNFDNLSIIINPHDSVSFNDVIIGIREFNCFNRNDNFQVSLILFQEKSKITRLFKKKNYLKKNNVFIFNGEIESNRIQLSW